MHIKNDGNLAHDFSVKLSPCMCSHVRLTWLDTYYISGGAAMQFSKKELLTNIADI